MPIFQSFKIMAFSVLLVGLVLSPVYGARGQGEFVTHLPAVAHMPGGNGSEWSSVVQFLNPNAHPQAVRCTYYPRMDITELPVTADLVLPPAAQVEYRDTLFTALFGLSEAPRAGSLKVEALSPTEEDRGIILTSQIQSRNGDQTLVGQEYSSVEPWEVIGPGAVRYLNTSGNWETFRYNLLAMALEDGTEFEIAIVACIGGPPLAPPEVIGPWSEGQNMQFDAERRYRQIPGNTLIRITGISGSVVVRGSLVDDITNDPMALKVIRGGHAKVLIELANAEGIDVQFRNTATLTNLEPSPAVLTVEYHPRGEAGGAAAVTGLTLEPCAAREYDDFLGAVLGLSKPAAGTLVFSMPGTGGNGFAVHGRSYGLAGAGGTLGQLIPEMDGTDAVAPAETAYFNGLRDLENEEGIERANASLYNGTGDAVTVNLRLMAPAATAGEPDQEAGAMAVTMAAGQLVRINRLIPAMNPALRGTAPSVRLEMLGDGEFYAIVSQVNPGGDGISISPGNLRGTWGGLNQPPVAVDDAFSTSQDIPLDGNLLANDTDDGLPSGILRAVLLAPPDAAKGALAAFGEDGVFQFVPSPGFVGTAEFTYHASDGELDSGSATVRITVTPVNHAPVAGAASLVTLEDTALLITLTGSDPDGDWLAFSILSGPVHGSLSPITQTTAAAATVTYTPDPDYFGSDQFEFQVDDGWLARGAAARAVGSASIGLAITAVNDAPTAAAQSVSTNEDTPLPITLTGSDVEGDALTFTIVTPPASGILSVPAPVPPASATLTYTPNADFNGADAFVFQAADPGGGTATATVSITVLPVNDPPTADPQSVFTEKNLPVLITLTGGDIDPDALAFTITVPPAHGGLSAVTPASPSSATVTYAPAAGYAGPDSFGFMVDDGNGGTATATVAITVIDVGVTLKKYTNGQDADLPTGPLLVTGSATAWTYQVTNTGAAALSAVAVTDNRGVAVACPKSTLVPGEAMTCAGAGTAAAGQYANLGTVSAATPMGAVLSASDPSHYFGITPSIAIEKRTNGEDADLPPGPGILAGGAVTWTYLVGNTGDIGLTGVAVADDKGVAVTCPKTTLAPSETMTCTGSGTAVSGPYANLGIAVGIPPAGPPVTASDPSHYCGNPVIIRGVVFNDANANALNDDGLAIPGTTVTLDGTQSVVTDSAGGYRFDICGPAALHGVRETNQANWISTTPDTVTINAVPGNTYIVDFGDLYDAPIAQVMGTVFNDANKNGSFDLTEVGIPGVTLTLNGPTTATATTNAFGQYLFIVNSSGYHEIHETDLAGWSSTTPGTVNLFVALGNTYIVNFGDAVATLIDAGQMPLDWSPAKSQ